MEIPAARTAAGPAHFQKEKGHQPFVFSAGFLGVGL